MLYCVTNWQCVSLPVARNDEVEHQGQSDEACWGVGKSGGHVPHKKIQVYSEVISLWLLILDGWENILILML